MGIALCRTLERTSRQVRKKLHGSMHYNDFKKGDTETIRKCVKNTKMIRAAIELVERKQENLLECVHESTVCMNV